MGKNQKIQITCLPVTRILWGPEKNMLLTDICLLLYEFNSNYTKLFEIFKYLREKLLKCQKKVQTEIKLTEIARKFMKLLGFLKVCLYPECNTYNN